MRSLQTNYPGGLRRRLVVVCLAGHALSCAPSDFDELDEKARDTVECVEGECLDGGSLEAGQGDDRDADPAPDPVAEDAAVEEPEAEAEDAAVEEPTEDAAIEPGDGAPDTSTPDSSGPAPACSGNPPVCTANMLEPQMEPCGNCGSGVRTRTRTCAADGCSWGAWSAWSACMDEDTECDPNGPPQTQTVACPTCGTKTQSRSCSRDTCTWGAWTDTSACTWCEECSEVVYCDTPANIADRGTWCRQKACSREQALSDCMEDVQMVCGATVQPFLMEYL